MTRTQLEELAKRLEEAGTRSSHVCKLDSEVACLQAAAFIRSLLAQEPVAQVVSYTYDDNIGRVLWLVQDVPIISTKLYASPVPAVDQPRLHETDIYNFAGWLTTRDGVMQVGATSDAAPMADAVGEYIKQFPDRFVSAVDRELLAQEPVAFMDSPHGAIRANPAYKWTAPQSVHWSIPLYAAPVPAVDLGPEPAPGYCPHCKQYTITEPLPAVDLEAFKAEAMRLANLMADNAGSSQDAYGRGSHDCSEAFARAEEEARAALAAHLDKLGGK